MMREIQEEVAPYREHQEMCLSPGWQMTVEALEH